MEIKRKSAQPITRAELLEQMGIPEYKTSRYNVEKLKAALNNINEVDLKNRFIKLYESEVDDLEDFKHEVLRCGYGFEYIPRYESPRCGNADPAMIKVYW